MQHVIFVCVCELPLLMFKNMQLINKFNQQTRHFQLPFVN